MNATDILKYGQPTVLSTLDGFPENAWEMPGACGVWSVKDIIAHLASYEQVLIDILARIHNRDAMQLILDALFDPDFELVKEACQAVRRHIVDASPKNQLALHKQVAKFMTTSAVKKNDRVLTSCLLLIGYIGAHSDDLGA